MIGQEIRIIIAGGRNFSDYVLLEKEVSKIISHLKEKCQNKQVSVVCGDARGADTLGSKYAAFNNIHVYHFPAKWNLYGKQAGPVRNAQMAVFSKEDNNIGVLIAFWDGLSKGTKSMIELAKEKHLDEIFVIRY